MLQPTVSLHAGHGQHIDTVHSPSKAQNPTRFPCGRATGHHVVQQKNGSALERVLFPESKSRLEILPAGLQIQSGLRCGRSFSVQIRADRQIQIPGKSPGQQQSLVEASFSQPPSMQGNGDDPVEITAVPVIPKTVCRQFGQRKSQSFLVSELETAEQTSQSSLICAPGACGTEIRGIIATSGTERKRLQEIARQGHAADPANGTCQRIQMLQAGIANGTEVCSNDPVPAQYACLRKQESLEGQSEGVDQSHMIL